jgi:hypothetical protein
MQQAGSQTTASSRVLVVASCDDELSLALTTRFGRRVDLRRDKRMNTNEALPHVIG